MKHEFIEGIFIESFGMLLDLLIIGALFTYFYNKGERRRTIKRYSEEIDDFRKWNENEATFRIIGNIKRLIKLGIHKIDLSHCYLMNADFTDFNIEGTNFNGANLNNIVIDRPSSNISHVKFWKW